MTRLLTTSLALAALGALGGCLADNGDEGMFISRVLEPQMCSFTASADEPFLGSGVYAIGASTPYIAAVQIESRITATEGNEVQRTIQLRGARVTLSFASDSHPDVDDGLLKFKTLFSGPVGPNGGLTDVFFPIVPAEFSKAIGGTAEVEVLANISVYGELGGDEVTSQTFVFPITMSPAVGTVVIGQCPLNSSEVASSSCFGTQQDTFIPCCTETDGSTTCLGDPAP